MTRRVRSSLLMLTAFAATSVPFSASAHDLWRPVPVKAEHARLPEVRTWSRDFRSRDAFLAFDASVKNGGHLAAGDLDGDGTDEVVVGAAVGNEPTVRVFKADGTAVKTFSAYIKGFKGGVRVAVCDTDGDGKANIVTAPGPGAESKIHVFHADGQHAAPGIVAYMPAFTGGAHVSCGDLTGDGKAEIVTTPGPGGGPHVRIFDGQLKSLDLDVFAYDRAMTDGVTTAVIRTSDGPRLATAPESWSSPVVRLFSFANGPKLEYLFHVFQPEWRHGVTLAAFDHDGNGTDEIAAVGNGGNVPEVRIFDTLGMKRAAYLLHDPTYRGALSMTQVRRGEMRLATMPLFPVVTGSVTSEKSIEVDLREQRLYAYERGRTARTFLISSGTVKYPTPTLNASVLEKIPIKDYRWNYGRNHPDNYDLKNVKFNLRIHGPYYIHHAYWHNNFGHRMSHGCINVALKDAEWIYNWADVGTTVVTHY